MAVSQNGWPVDPPRASRTVPGTDVRVTVAKGPVGDVLLYVLAQFDRRVEDLELDSPRGELDDWGYANRAVRGSTSTSNHASATAVDANATRHPLGVRNTFTPAQVAEIHRILSEVDNVVRWGGDYSGRVDEMHFEINAPFGRVQAAAARLNSGGDDVGPVRFWQEAGGPFNGGQKGYVIISAEETLGWIHNYTQGAARDSALAAANSKAALIANTQDDFTEETYRRIVAEELAKRPTVADVDESALAAELAARNIGGVTVAELVEILRRMRLAPVIQEGNPS